MVTARKPENGAQPALVVARHVDGMGPAVAFRAALDLAAAAEARACGEVRHLLAAGLSVREAAEVLGVTPSMVQRMKARA